MPELPEVEIIKLFLAQNVIGLKVKSIEILNKNSFNGDPKVLINNEVKSVERRAKVLRVGFGEIELLVHLKMSGQLILVRSEEQREKRQKKFIGGHPTNDMDSEMPNKSTRVIFTLTNPLHSSLITTHLYFNDQRKFGWIKVRDKGQVLRDKLFQSFGPEPLEKDFKVGILKENLLKHKNSSVKVVLLDQTVVAGVGNIYACEACFLAGINPSKKIGELKIEDFKKLYKSIIESLKNGIKYGGSSKTHFTNPEGKKGTFLDYAYVYGREKLPCKNCKTPVRKIKLGGRGTFYCPQCQVD